MRLAFALISALSLAACAATPTPAPTQSFLTVKDVLHQMRRPETPAPAAGQLNVMRVELFEENKDGFLESVFAAPLAAEDGQEAHGESTTKTTYIESIKVEGGLTRVEPGEIKTGPTIDALMKTSPDGALVSFRTTVSYLLSMQPFSSPAGTIQLPHSADIHGEQTAKLTLGEPAVIFDVNSNGHHVIGIACLDAHAKS